jgi:hypothetical protein
MLMKECDHDWIETTKIGDHKWTRMCMSCRAEQEAPIPLLRIKRDPFDVIPWQDVIKPDEPTMMVRP